ncbi:MAG: DUF58 domain-containing protein [Thermoplasmata archaeon]|nr:DUF58 domain-containing protein [Thermoplasmata archaeon]
MQAEVVPSGPRWRAASILLWVAALLLAAASIATRDPVPLFLALPLLLAPALAVASLPTPSSGVRLSWGEEGSGAEIAIAGRIEAEDPRMLRRLHLTFQRPSPIEQVRPPTIALTHGCLSFRLSWRAPFPVFVRIAPPVVTASDPLDLVRLTIPHQAPPLLVSRYPPEATELDAVRLRRTTTVPGEAPSRAVGRAGDFFSVRAATRSDTRRQINWRASARAGRLLANEFLLERTGDLVLVLDARPSSLGAEQDAAILSIARASARGIALGFLRLKARVGLAVYGEFLATVPLGSGRTHRFRLDRALETAVVAGAAGPDERLAVQLRRNFPPGVPTLLISTLASDGSRELLLHLRRRGFPVYVLSPSPLPLLFPHRPSETSDDRLVERLLHLVRRRSIAAVWEEAPVLDWTDYWSLAGLHALLTRPTSGSRPW